MFSSPKDLRHHGPVPPPLHCRTTPSLSASKIGVTVTRHKAPLWKTPRILWISERHHREGHDLSFGAFCPPKDPKGLSSRGDGFSSQKDLGEPRDVSRFLRHNNPAFGSHPYRLKPEAHNRGPPRRPRRSAL
jgi:hypothetical protein